MDGSLGISWISNVYELQYINGSRVGRFGSRCNGMVRREEIYITNIVSFAGVYEMYGGMERIVVEILPAPM